MVSMAEEGFRLVPRRLEGGEVGKQEQTLGWKGRTAWARGKTDFIGGKSPVVAN